MSKYKYVNVLKLNSSETSVNQVIKTPFSKAISEWTNNILYNDSGCLVKLSEHPLGLKLRVYQTANLIVTESNWELEKTGPYELTPKQP